ncbi:MAG: glycoside hydrolase family 2 TIM barrel-domain containing protein [Candidatus Hodarchaeota archaeon]
MNNWENPEFFRENKEPARAAFISFPTESGALESARSFFQEPKEEIFKKSPFYIDLSGKWTYLWVNHPENIPEGFFKPDFDRNVWGKIQVPSCVELEGHGIPIYSNVNYPFVTERKMIPHKKDTTDYNSAGNVNFPMKGNPWIEENGPLPVSLYHRTFTVPGDWDGREIFIHFDGVKSAFYLWVNGEYVGYSQDSMTPAEFKITKYLKEGGNDVAVQVHRWSDASFLEDQDMWRISGIYRDVYLFSTSKVHIEDFHVHASLDNQYKDAILDIDVKIVDGGMKGNFKVVVNLYEFIDGNFSKIKNVASDVFEVAGSPHVINLSISLKDPKKWSAEVPNLYHLTLALLDEKESKCLECFHQEVGFRKIEIKPITEGQSKGGAQFLINGQPVLFKGVNVHDWDPDSGLTVPFFRMIQDFRIFKQNNINAVRTSHYPKTATWYRLANFYGIYVMDECNLESHGLTRTIPADDDKWRAASVDRMVNMVQRDKNQPSIICWSLGNEAGIGNSDNPVHLSMKEAGLANDDSRPIQYENDYRYCLTDTIGNMYMKVEKCEFIGAHPTEYPPKGLRSGSWSSRYEEKEKNGAPVPWLHKPLILIEYATAGGNAGGDLQEYWDVFEKYPNLQGGFIWEYLEKCVRNKHPKNLSPNGFQANESYLIGGDFGEHPYDTGGCCLGLVNPDRSLNPSVEEMKKVYQEIRVHPLPPSRSGMNPSEFVYEPVGSTKEGDRKGLRTFLVENKHFFRTIEHLVPTWELLEDGTPIEQGTLLPLATPPRSLEKITIPFAKFTPKPGTEYYLTIRFRLIHSTSWAPAGHLLAFEQFHVPTKWLKEETGLVTSKNEGIEKPSGADAIPALTLIESLEGKPNLVEVQGPDFRVRFDKKLVSLVFFEYHGLPLIDGKMEINLIRAFSREFPLAYGNWLPENQFEGGLKEVKIERVSKGRVRFTAIFGFDDFDELGDSFDDFLSEYVHEITILGTGDIIVHNVFEPKSNLIRFGMTMPDSIAGSLRYMKWSGRGPVEEGAIGESYINRKQSCPVGRYESKVEDYLHDYFVPEDCGNMVDTRWIALLNSKNEGLFIDGKQHLSVSVWPFTQQDLIDAGHNDELPSRENLTLNVDLKQLGMRFKDKPAISPGKHEYTFRLRHYNPEFGDLQEFKQKPFIK